MRYIICKIIMVCFLAASIVSKTDGISAAHSIEVAPADIVVAPVNILPVTESNFLGITQGEGERCACEESSANTTSLICGVVLALSADGVEVYTRMAVSSELEWCNRFGPKIFLDSLKRPPRTIL